MKESVDDLLAIPPEREKKLQELARVAAAATSVILTTHVNADGDGAGSEAAVAAWLESVGVRCTIINPSPFPANFRFLLPRSGLAVDLADDRARGIIEEADLAIVLDTSEPSRITPLDSLLSHLPTMVIDHHPPGPTSVGQGIQDTTAAATGELVYDLIASSGAGWPDGAAVGVYVAIVSDTGSFRFSNTTPRAHLIAAEMLARGVNAETIFERLFATAPLRRLELLRESLSRLHFEPENGIAYMIVPREITERLQSTQEDYEGLIDHARSLDGSRVSILFRETSDSETKVSLRSSGPVDVNQIARQFGGGGHVKAAGATIPLSAEAAVERVLAAAREAVARESGDREGQRD